MTYFIGIQLPSSISEEVLSFQRQWKGGGILPHITVKAPCGLTIDENWIPTIRRVCQPQAKIEVGIDGVGLFGSSVLFLRVVSPELAALHSLLVTELGITVADQSACFEGAQYSPHVTLLQTRQNKDQVIPKLAVAAATERFIEPIDFKVNQLVIYRKEACKEYQEYLKIPFEGKQ